MALGTLVKTLTGQMGTTQPLMVNPISFAGDGAYVTGGTTAFQAKVQALFEDHREIITIIPGDCGGYRPVYDKAADKLKVFDENTGAEVANAANLSATTFNLAIVAV